jgi:hypothetical protein
VIWFNWLDKVSDKVSDKGAELGHGLATKMSKLVRGLARDGPSAE